MDSYTRPWNALAVLLALSTLPGAAAEAQKHVSAEGFKGVRFGMTVEARDGVAIIFETDGAEVTSFRAGRLPPVRWVEGCS